MASGITFKACGCRNDEGNLWGKKCPQLKRKGGGWSRHHGTWYYQLELPPHPDGTRRKARELSGASGLLFRRNSTTGVVEALPTKGTWSGLNEELHAN